MNSIQKLLSVLMLLWLVPAEAAALRRLVNARFIPVNGRNFTTSHAARNDLGGLSDTFVVEKPVKDAKDIAREKAKARLENIPFFKKQRLSKPELKIIAKENLIPNAVLPEVAGKAFEATVVESPSAMLLKQANRHRGAEEDMQYAIDLAIKEQPLIDAALKKISDANVVASALENLRGGGSSSIIESKLLNQSIDAVQHHGTNAQREAIEKNLTPIAENLVACRLLRAKNNRLESSLNALIVGGLGLAGAWAGYKVFFPESKDVQGQESFLVAADQPKTSLTADALTADKQLGAEEKAANQVAANQVIAQVIDQEDPDNSALGKLGIASANKYVEYLDAEEKYQNAKRNNATIAHIQALRDNAREKAIEAEYELQVLQGTAALNKDYSSAEDLVKADANAAGQRANSMEKGRGSRTQRLSDMANNALYAASSKLGRGVDLSDVTPDFGRYGRIARRGLRSNFEAARQYVTGNGSYYGVTPKTRTLARDYSQAKDWISNSSLKEIPSQISDKISNGWARFKNLFKKPVVVGDQSTN